MKQLPKPEFLARDLGLVQMTSEKYSIDGLRVPMQFIHSIKVCYPKGL